jgi:hypothetical protein
MSDGFVVTDVVFYDAVGDKELLVAKIDGETGEVELFPDD